MLAPDIIKTVTALCLVAMALPGYSQEEKRVMPEPVVGLWGSERLFGSTVGGHLIIDARSPEWVARIAGFEVPVQHTSDTISFVLPGEQGVFTGVLSTDSKNISGQWRQQIPVIADYRFSTPVELRLLQQGVWAGDVSALNDKISLYLVVKQDKDGSMMAFFRNPERAFYSRRTFHFECDGSHVVLTNIQNKHDHLVGTYDEASRRLSLHVPAWNSSLRQFGDTFEFTKRDRDNAIGFYPRTPATSHYTYRQPVSEKDGWKTASLQDVDLDQQQITDTVEKILKAKRRAARLHTSKVF